MNYLLFQNKYVLVSNKLPIRVTEFEYDCTQGVTLVTTNTNTHVSELLNVYR